MKLSLIAPLLSLLIIKNNFIKTCDIFGDKFIELSKLSNNDDTNQANPATVQIITNLNKNILDSLKSTVILNEIENFESKIIEYQNFHKNDFTSNLLVIINVSLFSI